MIKVNSPTSPKKLGHELRHAGMITDGLWTDFDGDGKLDLIVVGEFMEILPFKNTGGKLTPVRNSGLEKYSGWWNSITGADFDKGRRYRLPDRKFRIE
jgi:hypothetical protein